MTKKSIPTLMMPEEELARTIKCLRHERKLGRRCQRSLTMGKKAQRRAQHQYLTSPAVKIACAYKANKKLPHSRRLRFLQLMTTTRHWDWENPPTTPERIRIVAKPDGDFRVIYDPSLLRRAAYTAISSILRQHLTLRDFQYDYRGVCCAIKDVISLIENGFVYVQHLDIKNHFGSFDTEKLIKELPLPKGVVVHWTMASAMTVNTKGLPGVGAPYSLQSLLNVAHQGIPLGSSASAVIALLMTSKLNWKMPQGVALINYADNFLVLGKSQELAEAAGITARASIEGLLGGHFFVKEYATCSVDDGFEFLGHALRRVDGKISVNPMTVRENAFIARLVELENSISPFYQMLPLSPEQREEAMIYLGDMYVYARSWTGAFRACDFTAELFEFVKCNVEKSSWTLGIDPKLLDKYRNPKAKWKWIGSN